MDGANTPMSGLLSSLEAMIDVSVSAALDRRLGPACDPLSVQVDAAVTSALDRRLGPAGVDLDNRIEVSVARAIKQRFGPLGSAINAHVILGAPQPSKMANGEVKDCIPLTQRDIDAPASGRPLSGSTSPPPKSLPQLDSADVVGSNPGDNSVTMKEQNKSLSRELEEASSQRFPCLPKASRANALRKSPTPTDSGQTASTETAKLPIVEQGRITEAPSKIDKRKASKLENAAEPLVENVENEVPQKRKRAKLNPPGYAEGPSIKFLKVCRQLTARTKGGRSYPRVVDLESFTKHSNKQNFTMADVVATVLWNYKPESLKAFLDVEAKPSFSFVREEGDEKRRNFAIERNEEESGTIVTIGYHAESPGHLWYGLYEYSVEASGRWDPVRHQNGALPSIVSRQKIEEAAVALGSDVLQRELWVSGDGVEIMVIEGERRYTNSKIDSQSH